MPEPITRPFRLPPDQAVVNGKFAFGRFSAPIAHVNMLDIDHPFHYSIPRACKNWRLKEWTVFRFGNERYYMFAGLSNAKTFSQVFFIGYDRETKRQFGFRRLVPGGLATFPDTFHGARLDWSHLGVRVAFHIDLAAGQIRLDAEHRGRDREKHLRASFAFVTNPRQASPHCVVLPLSLNRAIYATTMLMPMTGELEHGTERVSFNGPDAMGVVDDHKGYYPYHMRYDMVTGFGLDARDRRVGFYLSDSQVRDQSVDNENCLWINSRVFALPPVRVTHPQGPDGAWIVQDTEGMVDLAFRPEVPQRLKINMGFIKSDYDGPFGSFKGLLRTQDGEKVDVERLYGSGEKKILQI